jgi:hypothetical protein
MIDPCDCVYWLNPFAGLLSQAIVKQQLRGK